MSKAAIISSSRVRELPIVSIPVERIGVSGGGSSASPLSSGIVNTIGADAIVVFVRRSSYPITSVTDTYGNTYSLVYDASSSNVNQFIYVATGITTGESNDVTVVAGGGTSTGFKVIQIALKNVDQVSPIYGGIHSANSGSSISQNITSNSINDVILSSGYGDSGVSTPGIGQTEIINETSAGRQMKITEEYTLGLDTQSFVNEYSYLTISMVSIVVKAA